MSDEPQSAREPQGPDVLDYRPAIAPPKPQRKTAAQDGSLDWMTMVIGIMIAGLMGLVILGMIYFAIYPPT